MDPITFLLLLAVLLLETISHLSLKAAAGRARGTFGYDQILGLLCQPFLWLGVAAFIFLFLAWLGFIARVPLAKGVMLGAVTIVGVMIGGRIFFGESITPARATATGLIAIGVVLVGWGGA